MRAISVIQSEPISLVACSDCDYCIIKTHSQSNSNHSKLSKVKVI